ncbi:MAG TPA: hypothetical protein VF079_07500 [Sphingomicrobium sp.]
MDRHETIIASIPGLAGKLAEAGVDDWLDRQAKVTIGGETFFMLGDRRASRAEAMLWFASERRLVRDKDLRKAASAQPLPSDVEGVEIDTQKGDS